MPNIDEIRAMCPDVSFKQRPDGKWTCRFFRDHACLAAGHGGGDCVVFPRQGSLPVAAPKPEPLSDVLGLDTPDTATDTGGPENGGESPGSAPIRGVPDTAAVPGPEPARQPWDMTWSASRIGMFLRCPYKFFLHYVEGLESTPRPDWAVYGSAMHEALENYFREGDLRFETTGRDEVDAKIAGKLSGLNELGVLLELRTATEWVVEGKRDFVYEHTVPGGHTIPLRWTARLDLLSTDARIMADHKSTGGDVAGLRVIDILYQMATYCMAEPRVETVKINTIYKPRLKYNPRKETAEAFSERVRADVLANRSKYFLQHTYARSEINPERHFAALCDHVMIAIECINLGTFARNPSDCNFGAKCEFEAECLRRV